MWLILIVILILFGCGGCGNSCGCGGSCGCNNSNDCCC